MSEALRRFEETSRRCAEHEQKLQRQNAILDPIIRESLSKLNASEERGDIPIAFMLSREAYSLIEEATNDRPGSLWGLPVVPQEGQREMVEVKK